MKRDQIQVSWKQLKEKFALRRFRVTDDNGKGLELIGAETASEGHGDRQPRAYRPDDREKRSEFGCTLG